MTNVNLRPSESSLGPLESIGASWGWIWAYQRHLWSFQGQLKASIGWLYASLGWLEASWEQDRAFWALLRAFQRQLWASPRYSQLQQLQAILCISTRKQSSASSSLYRFQLCYFQHSFFNRHFLFFHFFSSHQLSFPIENRQFIWTMAQELSVDQSYTRWGF